MDLREKYQILRDYQRPGTDQVLESLTTNQSCLGVAPTGYGKTVAGGYLASLGRGRVMIVTTRVEHEEQFRDGLALFGVEAITLRDTAKKDSLWFEGGGQSSFWEPSKPRADIIISTIDTLRARIENGAMPNDITLIVIDEAHHIAADSYQVVLEKWPNAKRMGLTATPHRLDGKGLRPYFDDLVVMATYKEMRAVNKTNPKRGLVPSVVYEEFNEATLRHVQRSMGDFNVSDLERALNNKEHIGDVVKAYQRWGNGEAALAFSSTIDCAETLCGRFREVGISAAVVSARTEKHTRRRLKKGLGSDFQVLCNVAIATEGTDIPQVKVIILDRPTESETLHRQIWGRGLRPFDEKPHLTVIDNSGNTRRLGFGDVDRTYTLEDDMERGEAYAQAPRKCLECSAVLPHRAEVCPRCDTPLPRRKSVRERVVDEAKEFVLLGRTEDVEDQEEDRSFMGTQDLPRLSASVAENHELWMLRNPEFVETNYGESLLGFEAKRLRSRFDTSYFLRLPKSATIRVWKLLQSQGWGIEHDYELIAALEPAVSIVAKLSTNSWTPKDKDKEVKYIVLEQIDIAWGNGDTLSTHPGKGIGVS